MRTQETQLHAYDDSKLSAQVKRDMIHKILLIHLPAGRTCEQLEEEVGWPHQTTSARVNELMYDGKVEQRGQERRTNRSGKSAIVWYGVPSNLAVPIERLEKPIRVVAKALYAHLKLVEAARGDPAALTRLASAATAVLAEADEVLHPVAKPTKARAARAAGGSKGNGAKDRAGKDQGGSGSQAVPADPTATHAGETGA